VDKTLAFNEFLLSFHLFYILKSLCRYGRGFLYLSVVLLLSWLRDF
jgi:hypothetical protein